MFSEDIPFSRLMLSVVLPPVPTAGLTSSDVGDLAVRLRTQMVETLRELSGDSDVPAPSVEEPKVAAVREDIAPTTANVSAPSPERDETPQPPSPAPRTLAVDTSIPQDSRRNGSDKGPETESDDGMVLVDRPDTPSDIARSS